MGTMTDEILKQIEDKMDRVAEITNALLARCERLEAEARGSEAAALELMKILVPAVSDAAIVGKTWNWQNVIDAAKRVVEKLDDAENLIRELQERE